MGNFVVLIEFQAGHGKIEVTEIFHYLDKFDTAPRRKFVMPNGGLYIFRRKLAGRLIVL